MNAGNVALPVAAALICACGGSPAPQPTTLPDATASSTNRDAADPDAPTVYVLDGPVRIVDPNVPAAAGPEALEALVLRDAVALVFGPGWDAAVAPPTADRVTVVVGQTADEMPRATAQVRLTEAQVRALVAAPPARTALAQSPQPVREQLEPLVERAWQERLCELRVRYDLAAGDQPCVEETELAAAVAALATRLDVRLVGPNPVPVIASDAGSPRLVREPVFAAAWSGAADASGASVGAALPLANVWLRHQLADGTDLARASDAQGLARFPGLAQAPPATVGAILAFDVDRKRLAGPLAALWPATSFALETRAVDPGRVVVYSVERRDGRAVTPVLGALLVERLRAERPQARTLPGGSRSALDALAAARPASLSAQQRELFEPATQGVDFVALVLVESDYASRLNTHRQWYEARAEIRLYNLWTGALVQSSETAASRSGLGASGADQAARTALGESLGALLLEWTQPAPAASAPPPVAALAHL